MVSLETMSAPCRWGPLLQLAVLIHIRLGDNDAKIRSGWYPLVVTVKHRSHLLTMVCATFHVRFSSCPARCNYKNYGQCLHCLKLDKFKIKL